MCHDDIIFITHNTRQNLLSQRKTNSGDSIHIWGVITLGGHTVSIWISLCNSSNLNNKAVSVWDEHIWNWGLCAVWTVTHFHPTLKGWCSSPPVAALFRNTGFYIKKLRCANIPSLCIHVVNSSSDPDGSGDFFFHNSWTFFFWTLCS